MRSIRPVALLAMVVILAVITSMLTFIAGAAPAQAAVAATGTGGQFVPQQQRIFDSREASFGNPAGKITRDVWTKIQVSGSNGLPAKIGAVQVTFTVINRSEAGVIYADKSDAASPNISMPYLSFYEDQTSNTGVLPVGADGAIQVSTNVTSTDLIIDVQGYYTDGNPVAGGYVPLDKGLRLYDSAPRRYSAGESVTVKIGGANGVPIDASAAIVSIVVSDVTTPTGFVRVHATGQAAPDAWSMNWTTTHNTEWTSGVKLGTDGSITVDLAAGGPVRVSVGVQGYFTAAPGSAAFTPAHARVYDSLNTPGLVAIPAGSDRNVALTGVAGIPAFGSGINAAAVNVIIVSGNGQGNLKMWADDTTTPTEDVQQFYENQITYGFTAVRVGSGGGVTIRNASTAPVNVLIDVEGWWSGLQAGPDATGLTGNRPNQTTVSFGVSDHVEGTVDVATGNMQVKTAGLSLPGITAQANTTATYNSRLLQAGRDLTPAANRWVYGYADAGQLLANDIGITYLATDGAAWPFAAIPQSSNYTAPAGLARDLVRTTTGYEMTDRTSRQKVVFDYNGRAVSSTDRNNNITRLNYTGWDLTSLVSTAGPTDARTAAIAYTAASRTLTLSQRAGSASRALTYVKDATNNLTTFTDAAGAATQFVYTGQLLTKIISPTGQVTTLTYDSEQRVTRIDQANTTSGSPGTATTRLSYRTNTETQVADPNTDTAATVATVPHTTYTLDAASHLVTKSVDAAGRTQSATYNAANNGVATSTSGTGTTASTTTNTYGANSGQSLTKSQASTGSTSSATYGSTTPTAYLPATSTDSSNETRTYGFDGVGNQLSTTSGSGAQSATAKLEYNTDGTIKTGTAPANTGNPTKYVYNANKQLSTITAPTGTTLGVKTFTYDGYGRMATQTDGRGGTSTFTYDNADRLLSTAFSDGTPTVTNTYDTNGNQTRQVSGTRTITRVFDQQNRLISTANTAGGGTIRFGYDKASHETSTVTAAGTTTHAYDPSGVLTSTTYPDGAGTATQRYATDDKGRRTDTWLASNADHTLWAAKTTTTYDGSGKVTQVRAWTGTGDASNTPVFDTSYCYQAATTPPICTPTTGSDRDKIQWSRDNLSAQSTTYKYTAGRLTSATQAGGTANNTWTYTYDQNGNRTGEAITGATPSNQTLTFNAASQITTTGYSYDGAGNLTASPGATYTYNGAQQMVSSVKDGVTTNYTYAGTDQNQLLTETINGGTAYSYVYGGTDKQGVPEIVSQTASGVGTSSVLSDPVTGQALDLTTAGGVTGLYLVDAIGNQVGLLTETRTTAFRVAYSPYGTQTVTAGATSNEWKQNPYGFKNGNRTDNGVIVKFGMRWYLASTGTWTQRDTLDAPLDPNNANRYGYAGGDPINASDPTGRFNAGCLVGAAAGIAFTAITIGELTGSELAAGALAAPTGGASLAAGVVVGVGFAADIAIGVSLTAYSLSKC